MKSLETKSLHVLKKTLFIVQWSQYLSMWKLMHEILYLVSKLEICGVVNSKIPTVATQFAGR
jgi:hypothetical protein